MILLSRIGLVVLMLAPATIVRADTTFPVTMHHAFGTTTIPAKPVRVATVAWANQEVPLALGIVPVGMARTTFGDDDGDGILPWVTAQLNTLGAQPPVLFDEGDGIDFEAVAATNPDVILATYSGLSQSDYDTLSQIAPVVAYPETPWGTSWRDMIHLSSTALGMDTEGTALVAKLETEIADAVAKHPALQGKTAMFVTHLSATDLSTVNFYTANDTRVQFFHDLGLKTPDAVERATKPGQFAARVSAEKVDDFDDVDILVTYGGPDLLAAMQASPLLRHMPAVENNAVVLLGHDPMGTASNPTPLSISWVLNDYVTRLDNAVQPKQ